MNLQGGNAEKVIRIPRKQDPRADPLKWYLAIGVANE